MCCERKNKIPVSIILKSLIFHSFKALGSPFSRLHQRLLKSFKEAAISLRHLGKSISNPIFYGDLVYKFKRIVGKPNFSNQFKKIVKLI